MGAKLYLALSATNTHAQEIKESLRSLGHSWYHFADGGKLLDYNQIVPDCRNQPPAIQADALSHESVKQAAKWNWDALLECDVLILAHPAGSGCYMEFGAAVAMNKPTILLVTSDYKIGVMDTMASAVAQSCEELAAAIRVLKSERKERETRRS